MAKIRCFFEEVKNGEWVADVRPGRYTKKRNGDRTDILNKVRVEDTNSLFGLLCMGVGRQAYPFSFGERGLPPVLSEIVGTAARDYMPRSASHSYLTKEELTNKAVELLIYPHADALSVLPQLHQLIKALPDSTAALNHQRIVFWFNAKP